MDAPRYTAVIAPDDDARSSSVIVRRALTGGTDGPTGQEHRLHPSGRDAGVDLSVVDAWLRVEGYARTSDWQVVQAFDGIRLTCSLALL